MGKGFKIFPQSSKEPPPPKANKQLIDAFCDTYKPVATEDIAEYLFTMRKLREYFQAWPMPKMPDPLPPYLDELEQRGYGMQTGYDGCPAIFCVRWKSRGEVCKAEEVNEDNSRNGLESMEQVLARRMSARPHPASAEIGDEEDWPDDDENEEEDSEGEEE